MGRHHQESFDSAPLAPVMFLIATVMMRRPRGRRVGGSSVRASEAVTS